MQKQEPKYKKVELVVEPQQSIARLATSFTLPGYRFDNAVRRGTKATVTFVREDRDAAR